MLYPGELLMTARIDGAGELRIFFHGGLRLISSALATIFAALYRSGIAFPPLDDAQ